MSIKQAALGIHSGGTFPVHGENHLLAKRVAVGLVGAAAIAAIALAILGGTGHIHLFQRSLMPNIILGGIGVGGLAVSLFALYRIERAHEVECQLAAILRSYQVPPRFTSC